MGVERSSQSGDTKDSEEPDPLAIEAERAANLTIALGERSADGRYHHLSRTALGLVEARISNSRQNRTQKTPR